MFFEVRFGRRGVAGCVLLSQIYKMSHQNEGGPEWLIGVPCAGVCVCGGAGESSLGADGRAWFVVVSCRVVGRARPLFFEVRFRGWGIHGCVLLTEIYKMSHRTYV